MPKISKKTLIVALIAALAIGGVAFAYTRASRSEIGLNDSSSNNPQEEQRAAGDKTKEEIVEEERRQQEGQNQTGNKTATVIITDAGQYDDIIEVRSFIPDHYQDGTCKVSFRKGDQMVVKETPARKDVSTTICMNPLIKRSEFPSGGSWQVTVIYDAEGATGTSEARTINIE